MQQYLQHIKVQHIKPLLLLKARDTVSGDIISDLLDWYLFFYSLSVLGFLDSESGSLISFKACFLQLPEFPKAQIAILHKSEFLEQVPGNAEDYWH